MGRNSRIRRTAWKGEWSRTNAYLEKIGEGGMGEVYLAEDTSLERKVAPQFLPEHLHQNETPHKRFVREAKSGAAIEHPFICNIKEVS